MKAKQQSTYFEKAIAEISSFQQLGGKEGGWELGGREGFLSKFQSRESKLWQTFGEEASITF